jgi:hypothetical protein
MAPSLFLALLAASASVCPLQPAGLSPTQEVRLARHFAPILAFHPDERFFPVDPLTTGHAGGEAAPAASLDAIGARTARYLASLPSDRTAMSVVYYRITPQLAAGRCRLAIEYFFYYLGNPYRSRGGVIPIRFNLWHPHDLERLLVLVDFPPAAGCAGPQPEAGRIAAVYPSAHGDSMPDNIRHAHGAETDGLGRPLRVIVELGSHAMAIDAGDSGRFVPGASSDGPRKFTWGIRDRGAPWAWYRTGYMDARGDSAVVLAPSGYRLRPAAALADALDLVARAVPSGDRDGRPSWAVRSFGEAGPETLLRVPGPVRNPDAAYGERTAARRERGFLMAASNLLSQFSFLVGGRWLVATPSLLPDVLVDAEGVLTYDGRLYTLVDVLATYRLDFATRIFAGAGPLVRWWSLDDPELAWEWVAGVEFRLGRLRVRQAVRRMDALNGTGYEARVSYVF